MKIKIGILGATGYTGAELLRLLVGHPHAEIKWLTSEKFANKKISEVFPTLRNFIDLECKSIRKINKFENVDVVFSCLPHGSSMHFAKLFLDKGTKFIDFSADFRFKNLEQYKALYKISHKNPNLNKVLEIWAGYGRVTPSYIFRARKIILSDPSARLLKLARSHFKDKKIKYIQAKLENLPKKVRPGTADLVILIRVLHHIDDTDKTFSIINKLLNKNGYFILEFANKQHIKATFFEFSKGNLTFPFEIFSKDKRSKEGKLRCKLPFKIFHPDLIFEKLNASGFQIIEKRSVSNIRSPLVKKSLPTEFLIYIEKLLQKPLSYINFGPSIFILAKKVG